MALFAGVLILLVGFGVIFGVITSSMGVAGRPDATFWRLLTGLLSLQIPAIALTHGFLFVHDKGWRDGFGIQWSTDAWKFGIGIAVAAVAIGYPIEFATFEILRRFGEAPEPQAAVRFLVEAPGWQRTIIGFLAIVPAAIAEEILFRGILYPVGRDLGHPRLALLGTALLFGAIHFHGPAFIPLTILGAGLAWGYARTGNLLTAFIAHGTYNAIGFAVAISGLGSKI
jgi:membrane protease YdiL (CAAX protease family)